MGEGEGRKALILHVVLGSAVLDWSRGVFYTGTESSTKKGRARAKGKRNEETRDEQRERESESSRLPLHQNQIKKMEKPDRRLPPHTQTYSSRRPERVQAATRRTCSKLPFSPSPFEVLDPLPR